MTTPQPPQQGDSLGVLARLREPFPPEVVGKLPRITCRDCSQAQGRVCQKHSKSRCRECGNYITGAHMHLDYVGHADVTDRLLAVDPEWTWEPVAFDDRGLPALDRDDRDRPIGLWIRLTVAGVSRLGYGSVEPGAFDPVKQLIGDALRNAAMRFGVALDLWRKEDAHEDNQGSSQPVAQAATTAAPRPVGRPDDPKAPPQGGGTEPVTDTSTGDNQGSGPPTPPPAPRELVDRFIAAGETQGRTKGGMQLRAHKMFGSTDLYARSPDELTQIAAAYGFEFDLEAAS